MTDMLFFRGAAPDRDVAVERALHQCAGILEDNPCLVVELVDLQETAAHWEAHIRVMALSDEVREGETDSGGPSAFKKEPKSPEHALFGDPNAWRPPGMSHDAPERTAGIFDEATHAGHVPDIPLQDMEAMRLQGLTAVQIAGIRKAVILNHNKARSNESSGSKIQPFPDNE